MFERVDHFLQLFAEINRHDGGRRLVRTQPVVVARARYRKAEKILIIVDSGDDRHQKEHELPVFRGR